MISLPFSRRVFDPTAEDLIGYYLKNHILRQHYPELGTIQEDEVYGEHLPSPWEKFCDPDSTYSWEGNDTSTPTLFLFTRLSDVGNTDKSSSIQKQRRTGCGTWHGTSAMIDVKSSVNEDVVIGHYRILSFRSTNGEETVGQWTMYEYRISAKAFPEIASVRNWQNQVVCRIKRDDTKSNIGGRVTRNKRKATVIKVKPVSNKRMKNVKVAVDDEEKPVLNQMRLTSEEEKKVRPEELVNQTQAVGEEEEKKVEPKEFVSQVSEEGPYGELTELGLDESELGISLDDLFDGQSFP